MQPQQKREPTTFRSAGPATRREIHNNVVQWRNDALARQQHVKPVAEPPELPAGEGKRHSKLRTRLENVTLMLVAIAAIYLAHLAGVL